MPGKWDGKSRIPSQLYKDNYNRIFGKKDDKMKKMWFDKLIDLAKEYDMREFVMNKLVH